MTEEELRGLSIGALVKVMDGERVVVHGEVGTFQRVHGGVFHSEGEAEESL